MQGTDSTPHAFLSAPGNRQPRGRHPSSWAAFLRCNPTPPFPVPQSFCTETPRSRKASYTEHKSQARARQLTWGTRVSKLAGWDPVVWKTSGPAPHPHPILSLPPLAKPRGGGGLFYFISFLMNRVGCGSLAGPICPLPQLNLIPIHPPLFASLF